MMATKDQERAALAKIKKIIEGLGENSYVATAFDGCFEMAESNIENDFANSSRYYIEKTHEQEKMIIKLNGDLDVAVDKIVKIKNEMNEKLNKAEEKINNKDYRICELKAEIKKLQEKIEEAQVAAKKDIRITMKNGETQMNPISELRYVNNEEWGMRFINVVNPSGWTDSYKIEDLASFVVE